MLCWTLGHDKRVRLMGSRCRRCNSNNHEPMPDTHDGLGCVRFANNNATLAHPMQVTVSNNTVKKCMSACHGYTVIGRNRTLYVSHFVSFSYIDHTPLLKSVAMVSVKGTSQTHQIARHLLARARALRPAMELVKMSLTFSLSSFT